MLKKLGLILCLVAGYQGMIHGDVPIDGLPATYPLGKDWNPSWIKAISNKTKRVAVVSTNWSGGGGLGVWIDTQQNSQWTCDAQWLQDRWRFLPVNCMPLGIYPGTDLTYKMFCIPPQIAEYGSAAITIQMATKGDIIGWTVMSTGQDSAVTINGTKILGTAGQAVVSNFKFVITSELSEEGTPKYKLQVLDMRKKEVQVGTAIDAAVLSSL